MNKTKFMITGERQKVTQKAVRWPCGVCGRGVGTTAKQVAITWACAVKKDNEVGEEMYEV